jgi:arylformamidase
MKIYDISLTLSESLVIWPGDPQITINKVYDLAHGDKATVTKMSMGLHSGTHIDSPAHFINGGKTSDLLDLKKLIGPCLVVVIEEDIPSISAKELNQLKIPPESKRILFQTKNSKLWQGKKQEFVRNYVAITRDGARWLAERKFWLVGVDYLSVASFEDPVSAHQILLADDIVVVEGLNLYRIAAGFYQLICLPLKIADSEAAPARVVLVDDKED